MQRCLENQFQHKANTCHEMHLGAILWTSCGFVVENGGGVRNQFLQAVALTEWAVLLERLEIGSKIQCKSLEQISYRHLLCCLSMQNSSFCLVFIDVLSFSVVALVLCIVVDVACIAVLSKDLRMILFVDGVVQKGRKLTKSQHSETK